MYVCLCKGVTDGQIREAVREGACTVRELGARLGVATCCGRCASHARIVLDEALNAAVRKANRGAACPAVYAGAF
ncbi:MAG: (2Fe-2S)-binding protein [Gammaproteobacteria bacterium]|nr:MAG: (2Fe-2S)-binding protein [Gammaproteobacteria bacterium]